METELKEMLDQQVTIEPFTSEDRRGKPSYGSGVAVPARIDGRVQVVKDTEGVERVSRVQVYVDGVLPTGLATITVRDRLTLPAGYSPTQPPILNVSRPTDPDTGEVHHYKVWTG